MAQLFNERLAGGPQVQLRFLPCHVYTIAHPVHGSMEVLAEEELDGTYTKWCVPVRVGTTGNGTVQAGRVQGRAPLAVRVCEVQPERNDTGCARAVPPKRTWELLVGPPFGPPLVVR